MNKKPLNVPSLVKHLCPHNPGLTATAMADKVLEFLDDNPGATRAKIFAALTKDTSKQELVYSERRLPRGQERKEPL